MIATNIWFWVAFIAFVLAMLALDLGVFHRAPHEVRPREAGIWTAVWVGLALLFAAGLYIWIGKQTALTFLTGYVIEESLSADNIFVMRLEVEFRVDGPEIEREHAERAIQLSFERYCSVASSLAPDIAIETRLTLNGETEGPTRQKVWRPTI